MEILAFLTIQLRGQQALLIFRNTCGIIGLAVVFASKVKILRWFVEPIHYVSSFNYSYFILLKLFPS